MGQLGQPHQAAGGTYAQSRGHRRLRLRTGTGAEPAEIDAVPLTGMATASTRAGLGDFPVAAVIRLLVDNASRRGASAALSIAPRPAATGRGAFFHEAAESRVPVATTKRTTKQVVGNQHMAPSAQLAPVVAANSTDSRPEATTHDTNQGSDACAGRAAAVGCA